MISFSRARLKALAAVGGVPSRKTDTERVPLTEAVGRVLAEPLAAKVNHPSATVSAMDGYALNSADDSAAFKLVATIAAGEGGKLARLRRGQAALLFTGARLPPGADAVVPQERAVVLDREVRLLQKPQRGDFVRHRGADFKLGNRRLTAPRRLDAYSVALAAAMNYSHLRVYRRPKVALLASGDELLPPGYKSPRTEVANRGMVIASAVYGIKPMLEAAGALVHDLGREKDRPQRLLARVNSVRATDLIITTGGVSVGARDAVAALIKEGEIARIFDRVAMRPGKPMTLAYLKRAARKVPWLGLPGNPVSSLLGTLLLAVPMVEKLQGLPIADFERQLQQAVLTASLSQNSARTAFVRAKTAGGGEITPLASQDSAYLSPLAEADCLVVRPPHAAALAAGEKVAVLPISQTFWQGYPAQPYRPR